MSPELLQDKSASRAADIWAYGCVLFQLLAGRTPFKAMNEYHTFNAILANQYTFPPNFPDTARDLIERILRTNPSERLGVIDWEISTGYRAIKQHPFFSGINFETLSLYGLQSSLAIQFVILMRMFSTFSTQPPLPSRGEVEPPPRDTDDEESDSNRPNSPPSVATSSSTSNAKAKPVQNEERQRALEQQRNSVWAPFLLPGDNEVIIETGLVLKKKGIFSKTRKRQLILTDFPRLFYVDPVKMEMCGEIPWSDKLLPELKNERTFLIHTVRITFGL